MLCHVFLRRLLVSDVEKADAGEGADEEDDVKPAMIEVELEVAQNLRNDHSEKLETDRHLNVTFCHVRLSDPSFRRALRAFVHNQVSNNQLQ